MIRVAAGLVFAGVLGGGAVGGALAEAGAKGPGPRPVGPGHVRPKAEPKAPAVPTKRPPDAEVGQALYQQSCWQCHGERGLGDGPAAAAIVGGVPSLEGRVAEEAFDELVKLVVEGRGRMPAFGEDIDKHNARRILVYLREVMEGRIEPGKAKPPPKAADADEDSPRE